MTSPGGAHVEPDDPTAGGRTLWWVAGMVAVVTLAVTFAALDTIPFAGISALFGVAALRGAVVKPRVGAVLAEGARQGRLALRVSVLSDKAFEPLWSRSQGTLWMQDGRTAVRTDDGTVVFEAANQGYATRVGNGWGKGGIYLEATDGQVVRLTLVTGADLAAYLAQPILDKPSLPALDEARRSIVTAGGATGPTTPAAPASVAAGWYPDPSGQAAQRWWDGTTWTDQTA
ncbi:MAG: DUF2510 domain-containing protein [Acidimicrobiales bacterium]